MLAICYIFDINDAGLTAQMNTAIYPDAYREWQNANKNKMQPRGPRGRILKAATVLNDPYSKINQFNG
jgi:hypothetical protein